MYLAISVLAKHDLRTEVGNVRNARETWEYGRSGSKWRAKNDRPRIKMVTEKKERNQGRRESTRAYRAGLPVRLPVHCGSMAMSSLFCFWTHLPPRYRQAKADEWPQEKGRWKEWWHKVAMVWWEENRIKRISGKASSRQSATRHSK